LNLVMSTADPMIAVAARAARRTPPLQVAVVVALLLLGGAATGLGWSSFSAVADDAGGAWLPAVTVPIGLVLTVAGLVAWTRVGVRHGGGLGWGLAAVALGAAGGVLVSAQLHGSTPLRAAVAAGLVGLAGLLVVVSVAASAARRRAVQSEEHVRSTGTRTTATVTDAGSTHFGESRRLLTTVTFTFTDSQGVQRWVRRPMVVHVDAPVAAGRESTLWYDAADPGDDRRIAVEIAPRRALGH
jgi:hypothetical protein